MAAGSAFSFSFEVQQSTLTKRGHGRLMKNLNRDLAFWHHKKNIPKHFSGGPETVPGGGGYRYRRRTAKYNEAKQKKWGHQTPLVWSGGLKRRTLSNAQRTIRATQFKWTLIVRGKPANSFLRKEIEAVSNKEQRELVTRLKKRYPKAARLRKYQTFVRKKFR